MNQVIYTPGAEDVAARVGRFSALEPMSVAKDMAWVGQEAMDIVYARKIMPVILEQAKNPFGNSAPILGAGGVTMFVSIMPPGQGPCLHSHNSTYETFMVLQGTIEYHLGDPIAHRVRLNQWDTFSCPPSIYRGFQNVGEGDAVQLTIISGATEARDDVSMPASIDARVLREHGEKVQAAFRGLFRFDPPNA
jgi:quercetin dioxygenase-like cupin family protein